MPVGNISISRFWTATVIYLPLLLLPGAATQAQQALVADPTQKMRPVTDEMLLAPGSERLADVAPHL